MARQFDRPSTGNMVTPAQIVRYFDKFLTALEAVLTDQQSQLSSIQTLQSQMLERITEIEAAQEAATAAQTTADGAQSDATASYREAARINSYPNPGVGIVSASDAGASATVTVTGHTRVYPVEGGIDVPDVAISGGSITGLSYSTTYYVYYDDTTLADTTPTFAVTTNPASAQVGAAPGRHFVGFVTTPASGGTTTSGGGGAPPGGGGGGTGGAIP